MSGRLVQVLALRTGSARVVCDEETVPHAVELAATNSFKPAAHALGAVLVAILFDAICGQVRCLFDV